MNSIVLARHQKYPDMTTKKRYIPTAIHTDLASSVFFSGFPPATLIYSYCVLSIIPITDKNITPDREKKKHTLAPDKMNEIVIRDNQNR